MERCLTLVSIIACIALGTLFLLLKTQTAEEYEAIAPISSGVKTNKYVATKSREPAYDRGDVCNTADCVHAASTVLSKMNREIQPCDDFYQFACGKFIEETQIPEDEVNIDILSLTQDLLRQQLKAIVEEEPQRAAPKYLSFPNTLYKACMNKSLIESLGVRPIQEISDSLGGWPVIVGSSWDTDNTWSWEKTIQKFRRLGFMMNYIVRLSVDTDLMNTTRHILNLDQPQPGFKRAYLLQRSNEHALLSYYDYMVDIAVLFGAEKETAKKELTESLQFEIDLAKISWPDVKRRNMNDLYNLRSIKQLQESYPYVQWLDYINGLLPEGVQVDENDIINVSVPSFFDDLSSLLKRTNKRVIANYLMWRIHASSLKSLPERFRNRQLQFDTNVTGRRARKAPWKECTNIVLRRLKIIAGSLYVRKHFKQESKEIVLDMIGNVRDVFGKFLNEVQWMDGKTKQEAKKKLQAMTNYIGYPDEILDDDKLEKHYRKLEIRSDKYFEALLSLHVVTTDIAFGKLRLPVNKTDWTKHAEPAVVNAFHSWDENSIQLPAGILQGHFFNGQRPMYLNYGAIGYIIGHEITHGFDDQGRRFGINGDLRDWWQPETEKKFLEKAQCIIEQYGNYTDKQTGLNLNSLMAQSENIADNGGIKQAYFAYKNWVAKNGIEPRLPDLNYTPQQLFWISVAQTLCAKTRKEAQRRTVMSNYSPNEFRVLGSLSNMRDFSRDFQCPRGTLMNPVHKCEVW